MNTGSQLKSSQEYFLPQVPTACSPKHCSTNAQLRRLCLSFPRPDPTQDDISHGAKTQSFGNNGGAGLLWRFDSEMTWACRARPVCSVAAGKSAKNDAKEANNAIVSNFWHGPSHGAPGTSFLLGLTWLGTTHRERENGSRRRITPDLTFPCKGRPGPVNRGFLREDAMTTPWIGEIGSKALKLCRATLGGFGKKGQLGLNGI